jgi:hypothetical protein
MDLLKQSTAATVVMGPMLDSTDGNTQETALTISQADIRLSKNGGAFAQTNNAAGATHMEYGNYSVPLNTSDTSTLGKLRVAIHESGALAVWREFTVVPAHIYDALVLGTDKLEVDVVQMNSSAQSAIDLQDFADAGYDPATNKVQGVVLTDTCTTNTDVRGTDGANTTVPDAAGVAPTAAEIKTAIEAAGSHLALILADTGTDGVVIAAGSKTGYALSISPCIDPRRHRHRRRSHCSRKQDWICSVKCWCGRST